MPDLASPILYILHKIVACKIEYYGQSNYHLCLYTLILCKFEFLH